MAPTATDSEKMLVLLNGPAGVPPVGVVPNFDNPPDLNAIIISTITACTVASTLAVTIRLYSKLLLMRSIALEDYLVLVAWVGMIGFIVPGVFNFIVGGGRHIWDIRLKDFFRLLYWVNVADIFYGITVCLIKLSILLQYGRIFVPNRKNNMALYVAIQILVWSNIGFYFVDTIFAIISCSPREKIWNRLITTGHCFDINATYMATAILNVVSDFSILILPMIPIWKLQMPLKKKCVMTAIFATGAIACAISVLRTIYLSRMIVSPDLSYHVSIIYLWTWAEMTIGVIVSCLPAMPKFFQHFGSKVYGALPGRFSIDSMSRSISGSKPRPRSTQGQSNSFQRALGKPKGSDVHSNRNHRKDEYLTLSELDMAPLEEGATSDWLYTRDDGIITRREELERGLCAR